MTRVVSIFLVIGVLFSLCLVSCKENNPLENVSSEISFFEESSTISKTETDGSFTLNFDPYVLPSDVKKALKTTEHYKAVVNAVLEGKDSVSVPTRDDYDNIRFALGENFPFAFLVSELKYDSSDNKVLLSYNFKDEHNAKIDEVKKAIEEIFKATVTKSDDNALAAVSIYSWLAQNIEVVKEKISKPQDTTSSGIAQTETSSNDETDKKAQKLDIYTALTEKKASAQSISALYSFLLMQLGVESKTASVWQDGEYYSWNLVCIDSKWYHCDIAKEQNETEGSGLKFFGMNKDRLGEYITSEISVGQWKWFATDIPKAKNKRFDDFKSVVSFEISDERDSIQAFTEEYSRFVFDF